VSNAAERESTANRASALRELGQAIRARPDDVLELADLPAPERARRLSERRRARALAVLERTRLVPRERLDELERLQPKQLFEALRPLLTPAGSGLRRPVAPATEEAPSHPQRSDEPARDEGPPAPRETASHSEEASPSRAD
jgi:hypothetical protein